MTGGLLQLKSYGSENIYLNANPQISFFRSIYRRHTNFSIENFEINYNGTPNIMESINTTYTFNIKRYADLLGPLFLVVAIPTIYSNAEQQFQWIKNLGSMLVQSVSLFIAGQRITTIEGETINNYYRLQKDFTTNINYNEMIGHTPTFYNPTMINPTTNTLNYKHSTANPSIVGVNLYIPLPLFFTSNSGLYLPLIALQNADVQLVVEVKKICELYTIRENRCTNILYNKRIKPESNNETQSILKFIKENSLKQAFPTHLDAHYVFLDNDERAQFAKLPHEYLIEQVQYKKIFGLSDHEILDIPFFHPTKEIRFFFRKTDNGTLFNEWTNFGNNDTYGEKYLEGSLNNSRYRDELSLNNIRSQMSVNYNMASLNILKSAKFVMNGQDRTRILDNRYWNLVQPFQYHLGSTVYPFEENDCFNCFSFSLEPDNYQPSGSCNLTHLKSFQLDITTQLPPTTNFLFLAHYIIELSNSLNNSSWRNSDYSNLNSIDNVFYSAFEFFSLQTTSITNNTGTGTVYGAYIISGTKYNVKVEPIIYTLNSNGTIQNNTLFAGASCKMYFYPILDIYYKQQIMNLTTNITRFELFFVYIDQPITNEKQLLFLNLNCEINLFDTYISSLSSELFNNLVNPLVSKTNLPYNNIFKSINQILSDEIMKELLTIKNPISTDATTIKNSVSNSFQLYSVDFINYKIYGQITIIQKRINTINGIEYENINKDVYNIILTFSYAYRVDNIYVIPLTNFLMNLYYENDSTFTTQIPNFPKQLQSYSLIIFSITELNNNNPNNLKNYLWYYDLFVEAHSYNLLRIADGTGLVAYST
jgi:hypothetical protein